MTSPAPPPPERPQEALPPPLAALLGGRAARPVMVGESGARVTWYAGAHDRDPGLYLKTLPVAPVPAPPLNDEAARCRWLAARGVPTPAVRYAGAHGGRSYLLVDALPGADASVAAAAAATDDAAARAVVHALADGLRRLHATYAADCPFRHPAAERVGEARARVRAGWVDADDFDEERQGRTVEDALAELEAGRAAAEAAAAGDAPVLTHGDYALENVILRPGLDGPEVAGFVDCGRAGLADRYQDLAVGAGSVASHLGARWAPAFLARYGLAQADDVRLRFYALLAEFF